MNIIETAAAFDAGALASDRVKADYVYMYPPRQAYRTVDAERMVGRAVASIAGARRLNLYLHFPFCRQICAFCNLYTIGRANDDLIETYLDAIHREIRQWADRLPRRQVATIYLGGGTPSLLSARQLGRVLETIFLSFRCSPEEIEEIALEVSPETVSRQGYADLRAAGFDRVNLGVQALSDVELSRFGRRYDRQVARSAIDAAVASGLRNVCVDLIYGLEGQTDAAWRDSLGEAVQAGPQTICTYALTPRAGTGYATRGYAGADARTLYRRYDFAARFLTQRGYVQENHVRFVRPPHGGYRQKANHWAGENVLGFGAGARSYLSAIDLQNGYALQGRRAVFRDYLAAVTTGKSPVTAGFEMEKDERRRKRVILGLFGLDRMAYRREFGTDPLDDFDELDALRCERLVTVTRDQVSLTERGKRHRDNLVQPFFSAAVRERVRTYRYR